jgi:hypothetical protein
MKDENPLSSEEKFRSIAGWMIFVSASLFSAMLPIFIAYHLWREESFMLEIVKNHYAALVGLPLAGMGSMCIVMLFKYTSGPIEFKALGFEFRGASGPAVLWIFCFLAITGAIRILW